MLTEIKGYRVGFGSLICPKCGYKKINLYRALIINNASQFKFSENFLNQLENNIKNKLFRYTGYGILSNDRDLLHGRASKITLYNEDEITYDDIHYYRLPIPDSFRTQSGVRYIHHVVQTVIS